MKKIFLGFMFIWFLINEIWGWEILIFAGAYLFWAIVDFLDKKPKIRQKLFRFIRDVDSKLAKKDKE